MNKVIDLRGKPADPPAEKPRSFVGTDISAHPAAHIPIEIAQAVNQAIARQMKDAETKMGGKVRLLSVSHSVGPGMVAGTWTLIVIVVAERIIAP